MSRFLLWLSGADLSILRKCRGESEVIKHKGYGSLVLVPAILAIVSMFYALMTISKSWIISGIGAIIWCGIVLIFDRFIVSTVRKSKKVWKDILTWVFWTRILFAGFIGFVIADPLVLLIFGESIKQKIQLNQRENEGNIKESFSVAITRLKNENKEYNLIIRSQKELVNCLQNLRIGEREGTGRQYTYFDASSDTSRICGISSNRRGEGRNFGDLETRIQREETYLNEITDNYEPLISDNIEEINRLQANEGNTIENTIVATDYLSRKRALGEIINDPINGNRVLITEVFLIIMFVFIDILPVTWKVLTKRGAYDDILETFEHQSMVEQEIHRKTSEVVANTVYADTVRLEKESEFELDRISLTMREYILFVEMMDSKRKEMETIVDQTRRKMNTLDDPIEIEKYDMIIKSYKQNFKDAFEKTNREFNSYIKFKK